MPEINDIKKNLNLLRIIVSKQVKLDPYDKGLCPFHEEKTPSFNIYMGKDRARYHCFGCGADGDIFNYLFWSENLSFDLALIKIKSILNQNENGAFPSLPSEKSEETTRNLDAKTNCFLSCKNYLNLKEDYETLLFENQVLRKKLNLPSFAISENLIFTKE